MREGANFVADLGVQASQKIVASSDPLRSLREISQSFPTLAPPLTRLKLNNTLKDDITFNQQYITAGKLRWCRCSADQLKVRMSSL